VFHRQQKVSYRTKEAHCAGVEEHFKTSMIHKSIAGIGIEADAAGIGIPASSISVRYCSIPELG
jgi:hypothetical protein